MQITNVEAFPVSVPLTPLEDGGIAPYANAFSDPLESTERVIVRVDTDEGISGWSEMRTYLSPETTVSILEDGIEPLVVGRSPFEREAFRHDAVVDFADETIFFAPIEVACWDIVGKELGRPVYELLGGWTAPEATDPSHRGAPENPDATPEIPVAYALGILPPEEAAEKAVDVRDAGYSVLKAKGGLDWKADVERMIAMHEAVDGDLEFRLDPNEGWTLDEAVRAAAKLQDAGVYLQYLEQPIRLDAHGSLATLRQRTGQPIAANEDLYVKHNLRQLIARDAIDAGVIDLTPAGGISGLREQAAIAADAGVPLAHHCAFDLGVRTATILHAVAGIPGLPLAPDTVYGALGGDVLADPLTVEDGAIGVPDGPGLGIEVDETALERYATDE